MSEITKNEIKLIRSLAQKKNRKEHGLFIVEGEKNVHELLQSHFKIEKLFALHDVLIDNYDELIRISKKELSQISQLKSPDKVLALVKIPEPKPNNNKTGLTLVLDNINDPGNLGTIIRTADWFGVHTIICSNNTVDCYNPKVVQSTKGSIFNINIQYLNIEEWILNYPNEIYAASLNGKPIKEVQFNKNACLIMGSESHGISPSLIKLLNYELMIPRIGKAESLNVGIATGIFLNEMCK